MRLTKTQLNYLVAIRRMRAGNQTLSEISAYLGVKKPTVSVALKKLCEDGYIIKHEYREGNEYVLTEKAWEILEQTERERFEFMRLFNETLGIDYRICDEEYSRLCGLFSEEFISALAHVLESDELKSRTEDGGFFGIPCGTYHIPFRVMQCNEHMRSMGDKGFVHPATLAVTEKEQYILLESKKIYYKTKDNRTLHGELSELSYFDRRLNWEPAEKTEGSQWKIPVGKLLYSRDRNGRITVGIIKIRASATTLKMPTSTAEISFNFEMIEKIE